MKYIPNKAQMIIPVFVNEAGLQNYKKLEEISFLPTTEPNSIKFKLKNKDYDLGKKDVTRYWFNEDWNLTEIVLNKYLRVCDDAIAVPCILGIDKLDEYNYNVNFLNPYKYDFNPQIHHSYNEDGFVNGKCRVKDISSKFFSNNRIINLITSDNREWKFNGYTELVNDEFEGSSRSVVKNTELQDSKELSSIIVNPSFEFPKGELIRDRIGRKEFISMDILEENWRRTLNYLLEKYADEFAVLYLVEYQYYTRV